MEGVNPFIKSNKHRMIMFLDELGVRILISSVSVVNICHRDKAILKLNPKAVNPVSK